MDQDQIRFSFSPPAPSNQLAVLDLFAGIGGISLGFKAAGFDVVGVDHEKISSAVFDVNGIGEGVVRDLGEEMELRAVPVVVGGPPCRPWSAVNVVRRGAQHGDHALLERYFMHLQEIRPMAFLMENVPPLGSDPDYRRLVQEMRWSGYSVAAALLRYSDFGAPTTRRRLFTVGFRDSVHQSAEYFFERLLRRHRQHLTVRDAIGWLREKDRGAVPDHEWSDVKTIEKYSARYQTGQFGWKQLVWDEPAPSFGSISKTYILHPSAGEGDFPLRVLSVREALSIMGFEASFRFPTGTALNTRYKMTANAVCPIVSRECAVVIRAMLSGTPEPIAREG